MVKIVQNVHRYSFLKIKKEKKNRRKTSPLQELPNKSGAPPRCCVGVGGSQPARTRRTDDAENDRRHVHRLPPPRPAVTWHHTPPKFEIPKLVQKSQKYLLAKFRQKTKIQNLKKSKMK
jgi:hypothetical protein